MKTAEAKMKRALEIGLWAIALTMAGIFALWVWILIQAARLLTSL